MTLTSCDPCDLVPSYLRALAPYQPGKPITELARELGLEESSIIKLASNENPLGPSPLALAAASRALNDSARYPDGAAFELKAALARKHAVPPACITLGNGSNDVLELAARTFLSPGTEAIVSAHAFAVYAISAQAVGARVRIAPAHDGQRGPRYGHDLEAMHALVNENTRLIFIANPNNPTGTWVDTRQLQTFIADLPRRIMVVVDEAYYDYMQKADYPDCSIWLADYANLIVTRTFSKAYALAGLRAGYALSAPECADLLNRVRQPFNLNSIAQAAAVAALEDAAHVQASVQSNGAGLAQLRAGFARLGVDCLPEAGNFICIHAGNHADAYFTALLHQGIIVRPLANYGMADYLRISCGLEHENARLLAAYAKILEENSGAYARLTPRVG